MINGFNRFFKNKRVLITGHTGFKGSWLCLLLNELGADVYGYALEPPTSPNLFNVAKVENIVNSTIGDIRNYDFLLNTIKRINPDIVIHMAAQPLVRDSYKMPLETYQINVMGTLNLLDVCRYVASVKVILNITTDKCYENKEWIWGYRENEPMGGYDPYSSSKGCSELVTTAYRNSYFNPNEYEKHSVGLASARAGNVIGGGDWANDRLVPDFIRSIENREKVMIRNPHAIRPWQHVLEPLSGYLLLIQNLFNDINYSEGWNFGPNEEDSKSVLEIVSKMCELWGTEASYEVDSGTNLHEANYLKLDCSKAKTRLNWYPRWDLNKTLECIVDWHKSYLNGKDMNKVTIDQIYDYFEE